MAASSLEFDGAIAMLRMNDPRVLMQGIPWCLVSHLATARRREKSISPVSPKRVPMKAILAASSASCFPAERSHLQPFDRAH